MNCKLRSVESVKCRVGCVESVQCRLWNAECVVQSVEREVWSVFCTLLVMVFMLMFNVSSLPLMFYVLRFWGKFCP